MSVMAIFHQSAACRTIFRKTMSLEMHVFLEKRKVPNRASGQAAVDSLALPLRLFSGLDPIHDTGFSPSEIKGLKSGFEIYSEPTRAHLQDQADLRKVVGNRDWCISFRWGGDLNECACVLAASAGLVRLCDAVAYYPDDDLTYDLNRLLEDFRACF
jgi:hypothetical protein